MKPIDHLVKRIVIKIGSQVLARNRTFNPKKIKFIAKDIELLKKTIGAEIIIVSSGAIMTGRMLIQTNGKPVSLGIKQALASVGQAKLMETYSKAFAAYDMQVAQVLLTHDDFESRERYLNAKRTFSTLLKLGIIPIVNENDAVSVEEIRFGDNDVMSAEVAALVGADTLVILGDVEGLYTDDPKKNPSAKLISIVEAIGETLLQSVGNTKSSFGTGGIKSKIIAAKIATELNIGVWMLPGYRNGVLKKALVEKNNIGTFFLPSRNPIKTRKHWIYHTLKTKGELVVDQGCEKAIILKGKSILPQGVVSIKGDFPKESTVWIKNTKDKLIAKGLSRLSSSEIEKIIGLKPEQIKHAMSHNFTTEIVHRDNLVIMKS